MSQQTNPFQTVVIRLVRREDVEALARLSGELGYPTSARDMDRRLSLVQSSEGHAIWVAQAAGDVVVGWVHVCARPLIQVDRQAEIEGLVVDPSARRYGIGRRLMQAAEEWAWKAGCIRVALRTNAARSGAREFYESQGYCLTKTQWTLQKDRP